MNFIDSCLAFKFICNCFYSSNTDFSIIETMQLPKAKIVEDFTFANIMMISILE